MVLNSTSLPILFFAPEAGITPHFNALILVARTLMEQGYPVLIAQCSGLFARCPVMDMHQFAFDASDALKAQACAGCRHHSTVATAAYGLPTLDLGPFRTAEALGRVREALSSLPSDLRRFEFDGIPFGRITALDLVYATKISDFDAVSDAHRLAWLNYIESSITNYLLIDELCKRIPLHGIVHYSEYSLMVGARLAAKRHGLPITSMIQASHTGVDRRQIQLLPNTWVLQAHLQNQAWPKWRELSMPPEKVAAVADDLLMRFSGKSSHVYSPAKTHHETTLYDRLGLTPDRKLLVAFTSSLDEMLAAKMYIGAQGLSLMDREQPFESQIDWLKAVCAFVEGQTDLQLVVRVHPREGKTHREAVSSQHLVRLREAFAMPPDNCRFVWPEEKISSYDLGELADVVLTSWSTMGLELARLGVPVLTATQGISPYPHDDFLEWGEKSEQYFEALRSLVDRPTQLAHVLRAFRCYHLFHLGNSLDFGDVIPDREFTGVPTFVMPKAAPAVERSIVHQEDVLEQNYESLLAQQSEYAADLEREAIQRQLRRLIRFFFTGEDRPMDYHLAILSGEAGPSSLDQVSFPPEVAVLWLNGAEARFRFRGDTWSRLSPLITRIAPLCAQTVAQDVCSFLGALVSRSAQTTMLEKARFHMDRQELHAAREHAVQALHGSPAVPEFLNVLSEIAFHSGNRMQAKQFLDVLEDVWPDHATTLNNLSALHWGEGDVTRALEYARRAFAAMPQHRDVVLNLGEMLTELGFVDKAFEVYQSYLSQREDEEIAARHALLSP